jgi:hypothetical protein
MGTNTEDEPLSPNELKLLLSTAYLDLIDRVEADVDAALQRLHCTIEKALQPAGAAPGDEPPAPDRWTRSRR